jgi:3-deoxy-D-arabino-heptulosonate 7-phosphate (DAHP) synthase class II
MATSRRRPEPIVYAGELRALREQLADQAIERAQTMQRLARRVDMNETDLLVCWIALVMLAAAVVYLAGECSVVAS